MGLDISLLEPITLLDSTYLTPNNVTTIRASIEELGMFKDFFVKEERRVWDFNVAAKLISEYKNIDLNIILNDFRTCYPYDLYLTIDGSLFYDEENPYLDEELFTFEDNCEVYIPKVVKEISHLTCKIIAEQRKGYSDKEMDIALPYVVTSLDELLKFKPYFNDNFTENIIGKFIENKNFVHFDY